MENISVLSMIGRELKRKHITDSALAKGLKIDQSTVSGMLRRPNMKVYRLAEISEFLNYNFFREIATHFPYTEPDYTQPIDRTEVIELQSRIKDLELEVSILRQTLKDVVSR
jgi:DNA-binding MarR family transcriptional regulator